MGAEHIIDGGNAFKQWLKAKRKAPSEFVGASPFMVNIRRGEVVGRDGPVVPDGSYARVDDLPSDGGTVFGTRLDGDGDHEVLA